MHYETEVRGKGNERRVSNGMAGEAVLAKHDRDMARGKGNERR